MPVSAMTGDVDPTAGAIRQSIAACHHRMDWETERQAMRYQEFDEEKAEFEEERKEFLRNFQEEKDEFNAERKDIGDFFLEEGKRLAAEDKKAKEVKSKLEKFFNDQKKELNDARKQLDDDCTELEDMKIRASKEYQDGMQALRDDRERFEQHKREWAHAHGEKSESDLPSSKRQR